MTTIDPCGVFVDDEFFAQNKLPAGTEDYEYTRCFIIYITLGRSSVVNSVLLRDVTVNIYPVFEQEEGLGIPRGTMTWDKVLEEFLREPIPPIPQNPTIPFLTSERAPDNETVHEFVRTALDFSLKKKTCVLIRLIGDFWSFSTSITPVTTKHDYGGQYYNLKKHWLNTSSNLPETPAAGVDYRCVSFFSKKPCRDDLNKKHGFSFNIDLVMEINGRDERLPITVDPDVENKGGN